MCPMFSIYHCQAGGGVGRIHTLRHSYRGHKSTQQQKPPMSYYENSTNTMHCDSEFINKETIKKARKSQVFDIIQKSDKLAKCLEAHVIVMRWLFHLKNNNLRYGLNADIIKVYSGAVERMTRFSFFYQKQNIVPQINVPNNNYIFGVLFVSVSVFLLFENTV